MAPKQFFIVAWGRYPASVERLEHVWAKLPLGHSIWVTGSCPARLAGLPTHSPTCEAWGRARHCAGVSRPMAPGR